MSETGVSVRYSPDNPPADMRYELKAHWYSLQQLFSDYLADDEMRDGFGMQTEDFIASVGLVLSK